MDTHDHDAEVTKGSQRLLLEAGYQPKPEWIFIDDLVQRFRTQSATSEGMLRALDQFLASATSPVTRAGFERFATGALEEERARQAQGRQRDRLDDIYAHFGVAQHDAAHEAMALRIAELEQAVKSYAERLRDAERVGRDAKANAASPIVPFLVGVEIGAALF